ncbi:MAG: hypothetical protein IT359_09935 [Gemmatimonadaceae bacterium]|nr:hypothetical protein [Gemmatimonadaceae bacterium]
MAQALLDAYRSGTSEAMERLYAFTWHRRTWEAMRRYVQSDLGHRESPDVEIDLDDARWLVAREHDFDDWTALVTFCTTLRADATVLRKPVGVLSADASGVHATEHSAHDWATVLERLASPTATTFVGNGMATDAMLSDLARFRHLTNLQLGGSAGVSDDGVRALAALPGLRQLDLSGTSVTDDGLQLLASLPSLETLSLAWTRVTDAGLGGLRGCQLLVDVNLSGTHTGDGALRALAGKPRLSQLHVGHDVTDDGIRVLHELPCFTTWQGGDVTSGFLRPSVPPNHLSLPRTVTARGIAALRGLDGLYALGVAAGDVPRDGASLRPLLDLPRLGWLMVDIDGDAMSVIAELPELRTLSCQDTPAGDDGWMALSRSRTLESIWGRRCHNLQRRGFEALSRLPALRALSVSCKNVGDAGVAALPHFPALRELMPMDIPDAGYRHIARCTDLEVLTLMYCRDTTDAATEHLVALPRLTRYFASYTQVTDRTPALLATIDSLESVTFDSCARLTNAGVAQLARLPRLREVRVSGRRITGDVVRAFPDSVAVRYAR